MIQDVPEIFSQPRRGDGAYPQWSVTEEQRQLGEKEPPDCIMIFLRGDLAWINHTPVIQLGKVLVASGFC